MIVIAIFNNFYSKELINDYLNSLDSSKEYLINISLFGESTSKFCLNKKDSFKSQIKKCRKFSNFLSGIISNKQKVIIIIPNANHFYCGAVIFFARRFPNKIELIQVAEGTLNYSARKKQFKDSLKRFFKKIISIFFRFNYQIPLEDDLCLGINQHKVLCRVTKGLNTKKSNKLIKVSYSQKINTPDVKLITKREMLIVGTHIVEDLTLNRETNLNREIFKENIRFDKINFVKYFPHPRSRDMGKKETETFYKDLDPKIIDLKGNVKDYIFLNPPEYLIALCGSTVLMELQNIFLGQKIIPWGFDLVSTLGSNESAHLKEIYKNLGLINN